MTLKGPKLNTLLVLAISALTVQPAVAGTPDEQSVKAAFLVKLLDYINWPNNTKSPPDNSLPICTLGADGFANALVGATRGHRVNGRPLVVWRQPRDSQLSLCRVVFVRGGPSLPTSEILRQINGRPILTVTDARYGESRGIIHFDVVGGKVGFHINDSQASRNNLTISSQVLGLAISVVRR
jgi:hypothetical protein